MIKKKVSDFLGTKDFRYMKIHIFALRWRDEIKGSSQLRTLLKLVVVNRTLVSQRSWVQIPYGPEFFSGPIYN